MSIIDRARNVVLHPTAEWPVIAAEPATPQTLYREYVAPLATIGPIATFIGLALVGVSIPFVGTLRVPVVAAFVNAVVTFVLALVGVFVVAWIVDALAPTFGGRPNRIQALKVVAYSYTPAFLAGIVMVLPVLAPLRLLAALYGLYLLYVGLPVLMQTPRGRSFPYAVAVVISAFVVALVSGALIGALRLSPLAMAMGTPQLSGKAEANARAAAVVVGALTAAAGAAQQAERSAQSTHEGSAAVQSADAQPDAAAAGAAAAQAVGSLVSGGKQVALVDYHALQALLPTTLGGLPRTDATAETKRVAGLSGSTARGTYGDGSARLVVEISDMGNASGLLALGEAAMGAVERESDEGFEKNVELGGRKVHEKFTRSDRSSELATIVADRFVVQLTGSGVDVATAERALGDVDFTRLAALH